MTDEEARAILKENFIEFRNGCYARKDETRTPSAKEFEAIDLLCDEWDCCYFNERGASDGE